MDLPDELTQLDRDALESVQDARGEPLDRAFRELSRLEPRLVVLGATVAYVCWRRRDLLAVVLTAAAVALSYALCEVVKRLVERARPHGGALDPLVPVPSSFSFPSIHAATAFAAAVAVGALAPRLRVPLLVVAGLVALSRVWLGVHYPSDVIAGALLGCAVGAAVVRVAAIGGITPAASSGSRRSRAR